MPKGIFLLPAAIIAGALLSSAAAAETTSTTPKTGDTSVTQTTKSSTLKVPGATIYYETQGAGPVLLIIPGGPQDAGVFAELAQHLADRYTVVAYDPRGNSRSTFDGEVEALSLDVQGDDAAALIKALGKGPAYVFGTSGGAQIGLNLAARHPDSVKVLVAHEPPTTMLLDDPSEALAADKDLYETYRREGVDAAMAKFFGMTGLEPGPGEAQGSGEEQGPPEFEMSPEAAETFARVTGNFEYWLAHGMMPLSLYEPDVATLRAGKPRIVVALGEQSAGQPIHDMGTALAGKLGVAPVAFPGDHMGFETFVEPFADTLHRTLASD